MQKYNNILEGMDKIIRKMLPEGIEYDVTSDLTDDLGLDSLKKATFVIELEELFDMEFSISDLEPENFTTIEKVAEIIMNNIE